METLNHPQFPLNIKLDTERKFVERPVCFNNEIDSCVMLHCLCLDCAKQLNKCPSCRYEIREDHIILTVSKSRDQIWFHPIDKKNIREEFWLYQYNNRSWNSS